MSLAFTLLAVIGAYLSLVLVAYLCWKFFVGEDR